MTRRWPLHPRPCEGEALSSWLNRLAQTYGMWIEQLLAYDLEPPGADPPVRYTDALDLDPPAWLPAALHERTGVPVGQVRQMTIAGWTPWLLDGLSPEPAPGAAFDTYVHQHSVLLTAEERRRPRVPEWRAWMPPRPMRRACPSCAAAPVVTLVSQLPLTLTCPEHGCYLAETIGVLGTLFGEQKSHPQAAAETVIAMDRRTHEGLRTGTVTLPRRQVHVGVWFRMLRTLIDELSTPVSTLPTRSRRTLQLIWEAAGHPVRAGLVGRWRLYEHLTWEHQKGTLEAAATALRLIETGQVTGHGGLVALLTPEPHRPVPDGTPPQARPRDYWREATDAMNEAIVLAREDPVAARQLLVQLTSWCTTEESFNRIREHLLTVGIPDGYLPRTLAETDAARSPSAHSRA